ncbi:uncharacterized protein BO88DRAFT_456796 [Aspergillus vadensis CBS 113365]|uniref:Uncharacterized protein n=1 Tax=Aspergillus vadensis (strain CBS 113365 / IMI 142717 / IBT 24658) TaxID=1448311 RepID=A0A319B165_ASPVC|nr:hypothetical protein BO88DRAFT_456796 [Aspergillus vadensis CBS 113365]PYH65554.1 hypothetical protein BO88DRAFT_456796 [Aspergillus vadensis CBS 113365]
MTGNEHSGTTKTPATRLRPEGSSADFCPADERRTDRSQDQLVFIFTLRPLSPGFRQRNWRLSSGYICRCYSSIILAAALSIKIQRASHANVCCCPVVASSLVSNRQFSDSFISRPSSQPVTGKHPSSPAGEQTLRNRTTYRFNANILRSSEKGNSERYSRRTGRTAFEKRSIFDSNFFLARLIVRSRASFAEGALDQ